MYIPFIFTNIAILCLQHKHLAKKSYICGVKHFITTRNYIKKMRNKILEALKTKFEGVDESILSRIAEKGAKTVTTEEEVTTFVEGVTINQLLTSYGDSRATEASQTAVKNYEKQHNLKDGKVVKTDKEPPKPTEPTPTGNGAGEDVPEWAKTLIEQNKALSAKIAGFESQNVAKTRRAKMDEVISNLPDEFKRPYELVNLESMSDEDFEAFMPKIKEQAEGIKRTLEAKGVSFTTPGNSNEKTNKPSEKEIDAIAESLL